MPLTLKVNMSNTTRLYSVDSAVDSRDIQGTVRVAAVVCLTGLTGNMVVRRVTIASEYGVSPDNARDMVKTLRANNPDHTISGRLVIDL